MTPGEISALRALCGAASDGPWSVQRIPPYTDPVLVREYVADDGEEMCQVLGSVDLLDADGAFLAAARTAIPALLDEIERLTSAEGGIRDAAIAYVQAAEDDPNMADGGLYRDLKTAVEHWVKVTARLESDEGGPDGE